MKLTKIAIVIEGVGDDGKPFKEETVFDGEIEGNWELQFGNGTGYKLGDFGKPADVRYTGERRFKMDLRMIEPQQRREYEEWARTMWELRETMG